MQRWIIEIEDLNRSVEFDSYREVYEDDLSGIIYDGLNELEKKHSISTEAPELDGAIVNLYKSDEKEIVATFKVNLKPVTLVSKELTNIYRRTLTKPEKFEKEFDEQRSSGF